MTASLPRHPNIDFLKKSAKQLLAAHRNGVPQSCNFLRTLKRFENASDSEILEARVTLADTQHIVAQHFGYASWPKLVKEIQSRPDQCVDSLDSVLEKTREEVPEYAGPGVPLAVVAALNHEGVDIDYMDFAASCGWAFSFGYQYESVSPAHMAIRGKPGSDGPFEVFAFLPLELGFDYEMAPTAEPEKVWDLVTRHVDTGKPIMSEHMDGGLITSYRVEKEGQRQVFFDGTVSTGWKDVDELQPFAVYCLVRNREPNSADSITEQALTRAVAKGRAQPWNGVLQGIDALRQYLVDVRDPSKDFVKTEEWFCWAAFERLMARRCCEVWLHSVADHWDSNEGMLLRQAANHYGEAFKEYDAYLSEVRGRDTAHLSLHERARTPERIEVFGRILEEGIAAETAGLDILARVANQVDKGAS